MGPIRSLYPGTTAAEVLALTNGSAFKSIAAALRGDIVEALTMVDCDQDPAKALGLVRRLQALNLLVEEIEQAGATASKEIR